MIDIRKAHKEDIESLTFLWKELIEYHKYKKISYPLSNQWKEYKQKELEWMIESKQIIIYIVKVDSTIVGYIKGSIRKVPPLYDIRNEGNIEEIYIVPQYRRQGLAAKLVNAIITELKNRQTQSVTVNVDIRNQEGQRFWDQLGFDTISIHKKLQVGGRQ